MLLRCWAISPLEYRLSHCPTLSYHERLGGQDLEGKKPSSFRADR